MEAQCQTNKVATAVGAAEVAGAPPAQPFLAPRGSLGPQDSEEPGSKRQKLSEIDSIKRITETYL